MCVPNRPMSTNNAYNFVQFQPSCHQEHAHRTLAGDWLMFGPCRRCGCGACRKIKNVKHKFHMKWHLDLCVCVWACVGDVVRVECGFFATALDNQWRVREFSWLTHGWSSNIFCLQHSTYIYEWNANYCNQQWTTCPSRTPLQKQTNKKKLLFLVWLMFWVGCMRSTSGEDQLQALPCFLLYQHDIFPQACSLTEMQCFCGGGKIFDGCGDARASDRFSEMAQNAYGTELHFRLWGGTMMGFLSIRIWKSIPKVIKILWIRYIWSGRQATPANIAQFALFHHWGRTTCQDDSPKSPSRDIPSADFRFFFCKFLVDIVCLAILEIFIDKFVIFPAGLLTCSTTTNCHRSLIPLWASLYGQIMPIQSI